MNVQVEIGTYDYSTITTTAQPGLPVLVVEARTALQIAKTADHADDESFETETPAHGRFGEENRRYQQPCDP